MKTEKKDCIRTNMTQDSGEGNGKLCPKCGYELLMPDAEDIIDAKNNDAIAVPYCFNCKKNIQALPSLDVTYNNPTPTEFLKKVSDLDIDGYDLIKSEDNFFIWKKINKSEYIRLVLIRDGWHDKTLFCWNLELSFKPFAFKHNHRINANIRSESFKANETDKFYNYFLNMIDKLKSYGGTK